MWQSYGLRLFVGYAIDHRRRLDVGWLLLRRMDNNATPFERQGGLERHDGHHLLRGQKRVRTRRDVVYVFDVSSLQLLDDGGRRKRGYAMLQDRPQVRSIQGFRRGRRDTVGGVASGRNYGGNGSGAPYHGRACRFFCALYQGHFQQIRRGNVRILSVLGL